MFLLEVYNSDYDHTDLFLFNDWDLVLNYINVRKPDKYNIYSCYTLIEHML